MEETRNKPDNDKNKMSPEKMDHHTVDKEIREGAGSKEGDHTNPGGLKKEESENSNEKSGSTGSGQNQDSN